MKLKVQTVLGDVDPKELGRTLPHEHLAMNFTHFYRKPPNELRNLVNLTQHGFLRQYPYSSMPNLQLNDNEARNAVLTDLKFFKMFGGGTIVENSSAGLERDVSIYKQLSKDSGVHVVAGTGYYIADMQADDTLHYTVEELYKSMLKELTHGCAEDPGVKAGFVGEVASVWPIRDFERRAIVAAGEVQAQLGCGVSFHPHRVPEAPFEILRLYMEAGGNVKKAVMSHLDRTLGDMDKLVEFAELGSYCQFDLFGTEVSYYQLCPHTDMPSDAQRLQLLRRLLREGKEDRLLMSHDIHTRHRLTSYGGHGYSHILTNVLPRMKSKNFSPKIIDKITIDNPAEWLAMNA